MNKGIEHKIELSLRFLANVGWWNYISFDNFKDAALAQEITQKALTAITKEKK